MTNPPSPSGGGMPKWLIFLLVALLVVILGCCGIWTACTYLFHKAAQTAGTLSQIAADKLKEEGKRRLEEAATQRESDIAKQVPTVPGADNNPTPETITGQPRPENVPARPTASGGDDIKAAKLPSNFPADVPINDTMVALEPNMADKVHGSGVATFSSTASVDTLTAFYEKQMPQSGWTAEADTSLGGNSYLSYNKDTRKAAITIVSEQGKTHVSIIYGPK